MQALWGGSVPGLSENNEEPSVTRKDEQGEEIVLQEQIM